jgi:H+/Cl- antiporter ClcA
MKKHTIEQTTIFLSIVKWLVLSSLMGIVIGASVTLFLKILQLSEESQNYLPFSYYYLLPFALVLTVWVVHKFAPDAKGHGTEKVIEAVHKKSGKIEIEVIPVKLLATVLTVFAGGSVGKEGPGAQIGAGMASVISDFLHFSQADRKKLVICGIGAGFASVFGTPIAGAIFGLEVLIVGLMRYDVLLPAFISGFAAFTTAQYLGVEYTYFDVDFVQHIELDFPLLIKVIAAGIFFGIISDITITTLKRVSRIVQKVRLNIYIKAFSGGVILIILSLIFGEQYFGLGLETINSILQPYPSVSEDIPWYSFLLKTVFTSITLGVGGSGGIVTPIFFIGATSGHWFGTFTGNEYVAFFGALGFISVLAGTTNTPIAATFMAMELFGLEVAHYAAIAVVISFVMTGHRSVFPSQILAMKKSSILKVNMGEDIGHSSIDIKDNYFDKIKNRLQNKRIERKELDKNKNKTKIKK